MRSPPERASPPSGRATVPPVDRKARGRGPVNLTFDNMLLDHNPYPAEVVDKGAGSDLVQRCVSIAVPL